MIRRLSASPPLQVWFGMVFLVWLGLIVARLAFLIINFSSFAGSPSSEIVNAFIRGVRFDLASVGLSITAPMLLLWIPAPGRIRRWLLWTACAMMLIIMTAAGLVLAGDIFFFGESLHHVTFEPMDMISDLRPMANSLLDRYLAPAVMALAVVSALGWITVKLFKRGAAIDSGRRGWDYARLGSLLPVLAVTFIGVRGGVQKEPLKSADAIIGRSASMGNIVLNGWYSFLTASIKSHRPDRFMDDETAIAELRRMIDPEAGFISEDYPLIRKAVSSTSALPPQERLNVVLIVVESLAAQYLRACGGDVSIMPFLDSLADESLLFTNFHAISTRSFRGVTAVLASYPNLSVDSYRLTFMLPQLRGMGDIFREQNYAVRFMHAAPRNSMGITAVCSMAGYADFVSQEDFKGAETNGSWGIWDHIALERMTLEMDAMTEPFHYGMFTLCTHSPWTLPDQFRGPFDSKEEAGEIWNTFAYLDGALRVFFQRESTRERFGRTLYVILGDHTTHMSEAERFRIGAMFFMPGRLSPRRDDRLADQMDVLPTVLDICGIETTIAGFGTSLLRPPIEPEWSIHYQANQLSYRQDDLILVSTITHNIGLYDARDPNAPGTGMLEERIELAEKMTFRMKVIYQLAESLINQNGIYPTKGL